MLEKKHITVFCVVLMTLPGCGYSSTLWQGADTVPEGKVNVAPAFIAQSRTEYDSRKFMPSADFSARGGLSDDLDLGGKIAISPGIEFGPKWRFLRMDKISLAWLPMLKLYETFESLPVASDGADPYVVVLAVASPLLLSLHIGMFEFVVAPDIEAGQLWQGINAEESDPESGSSSQPAGGFVALGGRFGIGMHLGNIVTLRPECGGLIEVARGSNRYAEAVSTLDCGLAIVIGPSSVPNTE